MVLLTHYGDFQVGIYDVSEASGLALAKKV